MELDCGKCKVRSWRPDDVESVLRHANNRKIWLNLRDRFPHPYTRNDAENWIKSGLLSRPVTNFAIDVCGKAVGGIGFEIKTDVERHSAEVGYWLGALLGTRYLYGSLKDHNTICHSDLSSEPNFCTSF